MFFTLRVQDTGFSRQRICPLPRFYLTLSHVSEDLLVQKCCQFGTSKFVPRWMFATQWTGTVCASCCTPRGFEGRNLRDAIGCGERIDRYEKALASEVLSPESRSEERRTSSQQLHPRAPHASYNCVVAGAEVRELPANACRLGAGFNMYHLHSCFNHVHDSASCETTVRGACLYSRSPRQDSNELETPWF